MVDKKFVRHKISLIQNELKDLEKLKKYSLEEILGDFFKFNTLERIMEKIVIRAIDINQHLLLESATKEIETPKSYRETFLELAKLDVYPKNFAERIANSAGMRNILVHEYDKVDYSMIYSSIEDCLRDYHQYCQYVLDFIDELE